MRPWDKKRAKRNRVNKRGSYTLRYPNGSTIKVGARETLERLRGDVAAWESTIAGTGKTRSMARALGIDLEQIP